MKSFPAISDKPEDGSRKMLDKTQKDFYGVLQNRAQKPSVVSARQSAETGPLRSRALLVTKQAVRVAHSLSLTALGSGLLGFGST